MAYKKYTLLFLGTVFLFVVLNGLIWKTVTEDILTQKYSGGDLARMGYLPGSKFRRNISNDLPKRHLDLVDYKGQKIDVITLGDSFSHGGGGGHNSFYQDYIASLDDLTVLNISPYKDFDAITTVSMFLNNGYLDKLKPRIVLIESAERLSFDQMAKPVRFDLSIPQEILEGCKKFDHYFTLPKVSFINSGNLKYLQNIVYYKLSDHAFFSEVYIGKLKQKMFTARDAERLLFLKYKYYPSREQLELMNDNLNRLSDRLQEKGIRLYFMPAVDKYTLYSDYLVKAKYQPSSYFEEFRRLPKKYEFIDTKALLSEEVKKGVQDIYYADDTHWGWKASEKIFKSVKLKGY